MAALVPPCALAHTSLEKYVRESVSIFVGAGNIDIRLHFSFPADLSLAERKRMDRDGDGKLSEGEKGAYLKGLDGKVEQGLRLVVNGQAALLIPLKDAVLDLSDAPGVEAHPHELNLSYFARVPKDFGTGGTFTLDSILWTDVPLMMAVSLETAAGIRFHAADAQGLRPPSKDDTAFRIMDAACTQWEPRGNTNGRQQP